MTEYYRVFSVDALVQVDGDMPLAQAKQVAVQKFIEILVSPYPSLIIIEEEGFPEDEEQP